MACASKYKNPHVVHGWRFFSPLEDGSGPTVCGGEFGVMYARATTVVVHFLPHH